MNDKTDHKEIWLEPKCCAEPYGGRSWCEENVFDCDEGFPATRYIRADLLEAAQAKIDMLMLEYCPEEMTDEQRDRWANCQEPAGEEAETEPTNALEKTK